MAKSRKIYVSRETNNERNESMKRYEIKQISVNWYGVWDNVKCEYAIESTKNGIAIYRKLFDC